MKFKNEKQNNEAHQYTESIGINTVDALLTNVKGRQVHYYYYY